MAPLHIFKVARFLKKRKAHVFKYLIVDKTKLARASKEYLAKIKW